MVKLFTRKGSRREVRKSVDDLGTVVQALSSRLEDLKTQLSSEHNRSKALEEERAGLVERLLRLEALTDAGAKQASSSRETLDAYEKGLERLMKLANQAGADIVGLEHRTLRDMAELRKTCQALAERMLARS